MWLFVPSLYAPESEASTLDGGSQAAAAPFVISSGMPTQRPLSWHGWKTRPWISLLSGVTCAPSTADAGVDEWMERSVGYLANLTPLPGKNSEPKTAETFGQLCFGFFEAVESSGSFSRTSRVLPRTRTASRGSSPTLPKWGGMHAGECFQMPAWEPHTVESASSSWPTPSAASYGSNKGGAAGRAGKKRPSLQTIGRSWPTPTSNNKTRPNNGKGTSLDTLGKNWPTPRSHGLSGGGDRQKDGSISPNLASTAKQWPTPRASDVTRGCCPSEARRRSPMLSSVVHSGLQDNAQPNGLSSTDDSSQLRLNTNFVEWLMGFPAGFSSPIAIASTAYDAWAMQFHRLLPLWLGEFSMKGLICND